MKNVYFCNVMLSIKYSSSNKLIISYVSRDFKLKSDSKFYIK